MSRSQRLRPALPAASFHRGTPNGGARRRHVADVLSPLTFPICSLPLRPLGRTLACRRTHAFDIARAGYVNLLGHPHPGDSRAMLIARRAFLERGHYDPLAAQITDQVLTAFATDGTLRESYGTLRLLDAGCGEGAYLRRVHAAVSTSLGVQDSRFLATDVSKVAVRMAATQAPWAG